MTTPYVRYSLDIVAEVCAQMAEGKALKDICAQPGMPSRPAWYKWMAEHAEVVDMYARAREQRADLMADEVISIADTEEDPQKARVRVDARKWAAAKMNPKQYGEKVTHAGDPNAPMTFNVITGVTRDTD